MLVAQAIATGARLPRLPEPEGQRQGVVGRGQPLHLLIAGVRQPPAWGCNGKPVYRYCASVIAEHIATHVWPQLDLARNI